MWEKKRKQKGKNSKSQQRLSVKNEKKMTTQATFFSHFMAKDCRTSENWADKLIGEHPKLSCEE